VQVQELINKQAEWSEQVNNFDAAAEMYIKASLHLPLHSNLNLIKAQSPLSYSQRSSKTKKGNPGKVLSTAKQNSGATTAHLHTHTHAHACTHTHRVSTAIACTYHPSPV
jgi:hypothetical protein